LAEPPEALGELEERADLAESGAAHARRVDRGAQVAGDQRIPHRRARFQRHTPLRLARGRAEMRGEDHVGERAERVVGRERLVMRRRRGRPRRCGCRWIASTSASSSMIPPRAKFRRRSRGRRSSELVRPDHPARLGGEGDVDGDDVGSRQRVRSDAIRSTPSSSKRGSERTGRSRSSSGRTRARAGRPRCRSGRARRCRACGRAVRPAQSFERATRPRASNSTRRGRVGGSEISTPKVSSATETCSRRGR
jgi:hypothetical protein